jgi:hypothetical protein
MGIFVVLQPERLGRVAAKLGDGDVLAFGPWRVVVADSAHYWLEGLGEVRQVARTRRSGGEFQRLIKAIEQGSRNDG